MTMNTHRPEHVTEKLRDSRFINKLKSSHYIILPVDMLFAYPELTIQEKFFYGCLVHYGNLSVANGNVTKEGHPIVYPSQRRLAEEIEISQPTVSRYTKKLAQVGLVKINEQGAGKHNWVTLYTPQDAQPPKAEPEEVPEEGPKKEAPPIEGPPATAKAIIDAHMARKPKARPPVKRRTVPDRRNSKTMAEYYSARYGEVFKAKPPLMTGKEFKHFKDLIDHYGYDKVTEFVDFAIDYYEAFRRDKQLTGNPTVGMIYGFRNYLEEKVEQYYGQQKEAKSVPVPDEGLGNDSAW